MSDEAEQDSVPGLYVYPKFIDEFAQMKLLTFISTQVFAKPFKRRVLQFGYEYGYNGGDIIETTPIPEALLYLRDSLQETCRIQNIETPVFDQCIVNEYTPGQGIAPHVDDRRFGPVIGCFVIGSGCSVVFNQANTYISHYIDRGALYIMSGEARCVWMHSIPMRKTDVVNNRKITRKTRYSITFRSVLHF
jgi:alkylated DNA repair dioxygenase AlkB